MGARIEDSAPGIPALAGEAEAEPNVWCWSAMPRSEAHVCVHRCAHAGMCAGVCAGVRVQVCGCRHVHSCVYAGVCVQVFVQVCACPMEHRPLVMAPQPLFTPKTPPGHSSSQGGLAGSGQAAQSPAAGTTAERATEQAPPPEPSSCWSPGQGWLNFMLQNPQASRSKAKVVSLWLCSVRTPPALRQVRPCSAGRGGSGPPVNGLVCTGCQRK